MNAPDPAKVLFYGPLAPSQTLGPFDVSAFEAIHARLASNGAVATNPQFQLAWFDEDPSQTIAAGIPLAVALFETFTVDKTNGQIEFQRRCLTPWLVVTTSAVLTVVTLSLSNRVPRYDGPHTPQYAAQPIVSVQSAGNASSVPIPPFVGPVFINFDSIDLANTGVLDIIAPALGRPIFSLTIPVGWRSRTERYVLPPTPLVYSTFVAGGGTPWRLNILGAA